MSKTFIYLLILVFSGTGAGAQQFVPNYDESKIPPYVLPDPLTCADGHRVASAQEWEKIRRPELLEQFSREMYGITPAGKIKTTYEILSVDKAALGGKATRKQLRIVFSRDTVRREMQLLLYLPNGVKGKVPVFFAYNYMGNHTIYPDAGILPSRLRNGNDEEAAALYFPASAAGRRSNRWPVETILSAGYGLATVCYHDLFPDRSDKQALSILPLFGNTPAGEAGQSAWQAIGAWAWGMSRAMDYFEKDPRIDKRRVILMGHSRQGKAALWAGAQDERFAIVISNNSGCGGAALSRRAIGETVQRITDAFPPWFCRRFSRYALNEGNLPFDQHSLIALIAPRPVYIASAEEDKWADPKGEFLSGVHAGCVYALYGMQGLEADKMPPVHRPVANRIGYHIRSGVHDVTDYDWKCFIAFASKWLP